MHARRGISSIVKFAQLHCTRGGELVSMSIHLEIIRPYSRYRAIRLSITPPGWVSIIINDPKKVSACSGGQGGWREVRFSSKAARSSSLADDLQ